MAVELDLRDTKTAGPVSARLREMIMPHVFGRFYENATGWLYDFSPGPLTGQSRSDINV